MAPSGRSAPTRHAQYLLAGTAVAACLVYGGFRVWLHSLNTPSQQLAAVSANIDRGDFASARDHLESLHSEFPEDINVITYLVDVSLRLEEIDAAIQWADRLPPSATRQFVDVNLQLASSCLQQARCKELSACITRVLQADPDNEQALRMDLVLRKLLLERRESRALVAQLDACGYVEPMDLLTYYPTDELNWEDSDTIVWLQECLKHDELDPRVRAALARLLHSRGRTRDAVRYLESASLSSSDPRNWQAKLARALIELDGGNNPQAADLVETLPKEAEQSVLVWRIRGRLSHDAGDVGSAVTAYQNALRLDASDLPSLAQLIALQKETITSGELARREEQFARWSEFFRIRAEALEAGILKPEQLGKLGTLFAELGQRRAAAICGHRLTPTGPDDVLATDSLALPADPNLLPWRRPEFGAATDVTGPPISISVPRSSRHTGLSPDLFRNVAVDVGLKFRHFDGGGEERLLIKSLGSGVGVVDFDLDQWPDLAFVQGRTVSTDVASVPSAGDVLFRNVEGYRYQDVTAAARFAGVAYGHGCAVSDFNNDGFADVLLTGFGRNTLLLNAGDGTFEDVTETAGLADSDWSTTATWTDFDHDGDVDLYVANYCDASIDDQQACERRNGPGCRPDRFPPAADRLWENLGDGTLRDVTPILCPEVQWGRGLGVVAEDFDGDGWTEIFVANDMSHNLHLKNDRSEDAAASQFVDCALRMGTAVGGDGVAEACMGVAVGDVDEDGRYDFFVTNYEKETNTFYKNDSPGLFIDRTAEFDLASSSAQMLAWGTQFLDLNHDGWEDLLITNSHLHGSPMPIQAHLNQAGQRFALAQPGTILEFDRPRMGRAFALLDWNQDGAQDIVLTNRSGPVELLQRTERRPSIRLTLIGTESPRDATGTRIVIKAAGMECHRRYGTGAGYLASNQNGLLVSKPRLDSSDVDSVTLIVAWPSGRLETIADLTFPQVVTILEGSGRVSAGATMKTDAQ